MNTPSFFQKPVRPSTSPAAAALAGLTLALGLGGCLAFGPGFGGTNGCPISLTLVAEGLQSPVKVVEPPDGSGRLFILEQQGLVRVLLNGVLLPTPFLDIRDRMVELSGPADERGLLGFAFHPGFAQNRRVFVYYSAPRGAGVDPSFNHESHVSEFLASPGDSNVADAATERILLTLPQPQFNHNGGDLAFGPDGYLYIAVGDGGGSGDEDTGHTPGIGNAQDLGSLLGKILRIDVNGALPYAVPADNPFVGVAGARPEVFAYGFRNPYRMAFDPGGARRLFAGDVGQALFEEVDIVERGGNHGWRIREGVGCFDPAQTTSPPANCPISGADGQPLIPPIVEYPHNAAGGGPSGISVIGGAIYRGAAMPTFAGRYLFGDFSKGFLVADGSLFAATQNDDGSWSLCELTVSGQPGGRLGAYVLGFGQDAAGEVYVCTVTRLDRTGDSGRVYRFSPVP